MFRAQSSKRELVITTHSWLVSKGLRKFAVHAAIKYPGFHDRLVALEACVEENV